MRITPALSFAVSLGFGSITANAQGASGPAVVSNVPLATQNVTSQVQYRSPSTGLDGPKVHPNNGSVFDWWYFDVVSYDLKNHVVVTFYSGSSVFGVGGATPGASPNSIAITLTFDNGTNLSLDFLSDEVRIGTIGDGSSGSYPGAGDWIGSSDMSQYAVRLDSPTQGVYGDIFLTSIALPHLPCTADLVPGANLELAPAVGWVNAMPDANATVNLNINGTSLQFSGSGYHDKNWGSQPLGTTFDSWYWGHGRAGPYSVVWFDLIAANGTEYRSSYVSRGGQILNANCSGISVRPTGANSTYPPSNDSGAPQGYKVNLMLGKEGPVDLKVEATHQILDLAPILQRWIGNITLANYTGVALFEQFVFSH